ncbi:MAG: hypothetical protein ACJA1L_003123 [Paracoccaceae bacterium]|jgi:hypothetical protein
MTAPCDALTHHVRTLGRGPGRSRNLTRAEAGDAMALILASDAAPEAVGAILMLLRFRGESVDEIASFVDAMHARVADWQDIGVALDWPSYAAGRSRWLPWFLLSVKLMARVGAHPLRGMIGADAMVRRAPFGCARRRAPVKTVIFDAVPLAAGLGARIGAWRDATAVGLDARMRIHGVSAVCLRPAR